MIADSYSLKLGPHPGAAKVARLAVERRLQAWALPELLDDVHLVTTELVSNAARLGAVFELTISRPSERAVLVEVRDFADGEPAIRAAGLDEEDGRGLFIVQAYAAAWGWRPEGDGKDRLGAVRRLIETPRESGLPPKPVARQGPRRARR